MPKHLAIIPDGNRRWAKEHNLPTLQGHLKGFSALLEIARASRQWGIHTVTIWIFSTENWKRDKAEVEYLMKIEEEMLRKYLPELMKDKVRVIHLGRKDRIPKSFAQTLTNIETKTRKNTKHVLNVAVDYGGRDEILRAMARFPGLKALNPGNRTWKEEDFAKFLDTGDQPYPNPDLLIRTSGEMRTSGLLPWQTVYTEFVFLKKHLPDCTTEDLKEAILEYSKRKRRFGGNG